MSDLEIPVAAQDAGERAFCGWLRNRDPQLWPASTVAVVLNAAGPLIVAAELRRIGDAICSIADPAANAWMKAKDAGRREIRRELFARADELDPQGGAQ